MRAIQTVYVVYRLRNNLLLIAISWVLLNSKPMIINSKRVYSLNDNLSSTVKVSSYNVERVRKSGLSDECDGINNRFPVAQSQLLSEFIRSYFFGSFRFRLEKSNDSKTFCIILAFKTSILLLTCFCSVI
jgi:hypothetical protein